MRKPFGLFLPLLLLLPSCQKATLYLAKDPNSNLELYLTQAVKDEDLTDLYYLPIGFGVEVYLSVPPLENGAKPDQCVRYQLTAYPDYADGGRYVTGISITDPTYTVYGLTINSSADDFKVAMEEWGFALSESGLSADWGNGSIGLTPGKSLRLQAKVTNRDNIIF